MDIDGPITFSEFGIARLLRDIRRVDREEEPVLKVRAVRHLCLVENRETA